MWFVEVNQVQEERCVGFKDLFICELNSVDLIVLTMLSLSLSLISSPPLSVSLSFFSLHHLRLSFDDIVQMEP